MSNQAAQTMPELPEPFDVIEQVDKYNFVHNVEVYTADQMHQYARDYALSQAAGVPDVLFDGYAVYQGMTDEARARINAGGVSDVLDSVVRLIRAQAAPAASGGESAASLSSNPNPVTPSLSSESAASVSERARELLAAVYEADGWVHHATDIRSGVTAKREVRALEQALTQQRGEGAG